MDEGEVRLQRATSVRLRRRRDQVSCDWWTGVT